MYCVEILPPEPGRSTLPDEYCFRRAETLEEVEDLRLIYGSRFVGFRQLSKGEALPAQTPWWEPVEPPG
jgi:hypothetical protein